MNLRGLIVALLFLVGLQNPALAREAILNFISEATVNTDGSLDVVETLLINSEGNEIKRGIFRDFPTKYTTPNGLKVTVDFDVNKVERDGRVENFVLESLSNGVRVKIGNRDVFLDDGQHTYKIYYRTTRQIGFFDDQDELFWNVTGNGWPFPIERAEAIINLPNGAAIYKTAVFTGLFQSTEKNARILSSRGKVFQAETTGILEPNEGFSVGVSWQKGIVIPPTAAETQALAIRDNAGLAALFGTLILAGIYYLFAWNKVGRDPKGGAIIPLFRPPENIGPAGVRYIWKQNFDDRSFAAAVVGMAVKGGVSITDDGDDFAITKKPTNFNVFNRSEQALYQALPEGKLELDNSNHTAVRKAKSALADTLAQEYKGAMFLKNFGWFVVGAIISVAGVALSALLMGGSDGQLGLMLAGWGAVWWGVILTVAWSAVKGLFAASSGWLNRIASVGRLLFMIPFAFAGVGVPFAMSLDTEWSPALVWLIGGAVALGLLNLLFYHLMKAPTPIGRQTLDQIEGFRVYMTTAEEKRLEILHPPEKTPALFEKYLPYALALDCENQWNAKFASVLAAAAATGAAVGAGWYYGNNMGSIGGSDFTDRLGSNLTNSVSSSSTPPGTSGGSSGGGFSGGGGSSGGGGGGGGGGGW